jgi:hypothetical protein
MPLIIIPSIAIFTLELLFFLRRPLSVFRFFSFCYATIVGLGVPMVMLIDAISGYKFQLRDLDRIQIMYVCGYALIYIGALPVMVSGRLLRDKAGASQTRLTDFGESPLTFAQRGGLVVLLLMSLGATLIYLATSGFSFGSSGYESRYEEASGSGPLLLFIPAFLPYAAYRLATAKSLGKFLLIALVLIAFNVFIFMLLSGYRQLLIGSALLCMIVAVDRGFIPRWTIIPAAVIVFPLVALSMSFARYSGEESTPFADKTAAALYYIQGDVFPIDAPMRIMWFCDIQPCPGTDVFVSHLQKFVPRGAWPDKPKILPDSAGFYTQTVLNYKRQLTLSATIMGEALLMGSMMQAALVMILSGFFAALMTSLFFAARPSISYFIYLANIYIGFFWVREGFEDAINRVIIMLIYAFIAVTCAILLKGVRRS